MVYNTIKGLLCVPTVRCIYCDFEANSKPPSYKERAMMPYTEGVLLEVIRHSKMMPTLLPHTLSQEITISGHVSMSELYDSWLVILFD